MDLLLPGNHGDIVPTFLALSKVLPQAGFPKHAERAVQFLLPVQLPEGGFPGLEIANNRVTPSAFNTGQILHGLTAWYRQTGDEGVRIAAERAARWLLSVQDPDGAFRRYTYENTASTYSASLAWWLAEWGNYAADRAALTGAGRHLDWALPHQRPNDWIALTSFDKGQHRDDEAFTHSIAYAIAGVLATAEIAVKEPALLMPVQRVVGSIEIEGDLLRCLAMRFEERDRQRAARSLPRHS
jgi:hypothetical protein